MPARLTAQRKKLPPQSKNGGKAVRPSREDGDRYARLLAEANANPLRLFLVNEIRCLFKISDAAMRRYRKLAAFEPATDPWDGDRTSMLKFNEWYWTNRVRLEKEHPDTR